MPPRAPNSAAEFDDAIERAAKLLAASAFPVIAGLGTDVAGVVAALRLAEVVGGAFDHMVAEASLRDQAVLHDVGQMLVSPGEARQRADTFLLVGDRPLQAWPDLPEFLFAPGGTHFSEDAPRRGILAISGRDPSLHDQGEVTWLQAEIAAIPALLAAIRACLNGRPLASGFDSSQVDILVGRLKAASFGAALWSPGEIDALTIEMLTGLLKDLNAETRWSGISVADDLSVVGAAMASAWMSGFPLRTGFGRGLSEHDPWRFDARRLVESGEADAAVWISAFGDPLPDWLDFVPTIFVADPSALASVADAILLSIGRPGRDHDAILYDRRTGTLAEVFASSPRAMPTVADALNRLAARLAAP